MKFVRPDCETCVCSQVSVIKNDVDILLKSTNGRMLIVNTASIPAKATKDNGGIGVMTQKKGQRLLSAELYEKGSLESEHRYRTRNLPAAGNKLPTGGQAEQSKLEI